MPIDFPSDKPSPAVTSKTVHSGSDLSGTDKSASVEATPKASAESHKLSREQALQIIKAIVTEVKTSPATIDNGSGKATERAVYEATIQVNPKHTYSSIAIKSNLPTIEQLDVNTLQRIREGQTLDIRVSTQAPLKLGHQLQVQLAGKAIRLLQIAPPSLQSTLNHFIRHEINQQNSYTNLLAKLISLATMVKTNPVKPDNAANSQNTGTPLLQKKITTATTNPLLPPNSTPKSPGATNNTGQITKVAQEFIKSMPLLSQVSTAQGLKSAIKNSGIFYENNVTKMAQQPLSKTQNPSELSSQIKQQLKSLQAALSIKGSSLVASNDNNLSKPSSEATKNIHTNTNTNTNTKPLQSLIQNDVKAKLLNLQKQLAQINQTKLVLDTSPTTAKLADKPLGTTQPANSNSFTSDAVPKPAIGTKESPRTNIPANATPTKNALQKNLDDGNLLNSKSQTGDPIVKANTSEKTQGVNNKQEQLNRALPLVYQKPVTNHQHTTQTASSPTSPAGAARTAIQTPQSGLVKSGLDSSNTIFQPPLPGVFNVQAQAVRPQPLNKETLADALISVLIKHTKEATSRLNLHQLASLTDMTRMDGGQQNVSLSFELPVLQGNELALFQFRIHKEEQENGEKKSKNNQEKKWVVHMGFDLEGLGAMYCQVTLIGVNANVTFWAEQSQTVAQSKSHMDELRKNLNNLGVSVKDMQCIQGAPPTDQSGIKQTLIDIET